MSSISLIRGFVNHWLNAVDQHSLHAPFAYNFYEQVILNNQPEEIFQKIEAHRKAYLESKATINVQSPGAPSRVSSRHLRKISDIAAKGLTPARSSRLLYRIGQSLEPKVIVELGTSLGINTLYLSSSWPHATVYTFEGCPETAAQARRLFTKWPCQNIRLIEGNIDETLPDLLSGIEDKIGLAYLDANHRYQPTLDYYQQLRAHSTEESVLVLDDIYWSKGMKQAWKELCRRPEVSLSLDLYDMGILFFRNKPVKEHHYLRY